MGDINHDALTLLGLIAGILGTFTGLIFWAVKVQVGSLKADHHQTSHKLQGHIDDKFGELSGEIKAQAKRIDVHDKQLHQREVDQLALRNEMLENMRNQYVRHDDVTEIKQQIKAIFDRLDKVIFGTSGGGK